MKAHASNQRLLLPRLESIAVEGVHLYGSGKRFELEFGSSLTAILGANGLGKSTLLNLALYAVTSCVKSPGEVPTGIKGARGFFGQGQEFATRFFEGRVRRQDERKARIEARFSIGKREFWISRGFFSKAGIQELAIDGANIKGASASLTEKYCESVAKASQAASFEQFCFVVWTLNYFGEDRFCLFWEQETLNQLFHTVLSGSPDEGERLNQALAKFKKHDSHARNIQWQISKEKSLIKEWSAAQTSGALDVKKAEPTLKELSIEQELVRRKEGELRERLSHALIKRDEARISVDRTSRELEAMTWKAVASGSVPLEQSPMAIQFSRNAVCPFCRTKHEQVPVLYTRKLKAHACPLCEAQTGGRKAGKSTPSASISALQNQMAEVEALLREQEQVIESLNRESAELEVRKGVIDTKIKKLEHSFKQSFADLEAALASRNLSKSGLEGKRVAISLLEKQKADHVEVRDAAAVEVREIQRTLHEGFLRVRKELTPVFQRLASEFIGLPLELTATQAPRSNRAMVEFHLTLNGDRRTSPEDLSESQRFFLDIALRMTLLQLSGGGGNLPTLLIDTPEGSLDIAYETNAGAMFASYMKQDKGHMFCAFNLNSSNLTKEMLRQYPHRRSVELLDLREWSRPTPVQEKRAPLMNGQLDNLRGLLS